MNYAQREIATLNFGNEGLDRGAVEESMAPWDKTVLAFKEQGFDSGLLDELAPPSLPTENLYYVKRPYEEWERFYNTMKTQAVCEYETSLGWDPLKRISFRIPFISFDEEVLEDTPEYTLKKDRDGWVRKYAKGRNLVEDISPVVEDADDWEKLKAHTIQQLKLHCTPENMEKAYGKYRGKEDEFAVRFRIQGFFWCPRDLMGVEEHLVAHMLDPDLLKEISRFQLDVYKEQLNGILKIVKPSTLFFEEDFSGANGPMISPAMYSEFIVPCYQEIVPFLKERGVGQVFLDTDGDFTPMIPLIFESGIDGVLPVDVNAGVDIVQVRKNYPTLKFWGGFDKLALIDGPVSIDAEFKRLEPVIRQGGCIICTDHQAAPHTPLANYKYYVKRLREVMTEMRSEKAV